MNTTHDVLIDLDGVLADFSGACRDKLGIDLATVSRGELWGKVQRHNDQVEDWFYSLPLMEDALVLWDYATANFASVAILSASGRTPSGAAGQKRAWVAKHLSTSVVANIVVGANDKATFANANAILIDDRDKAIDPFVKAGGIGVLHTSAVDTIAQLEELKKGWG